MDRESLARMLERGYSLAEIGRRFGKHPSTVGYWVQKHGLEAAHGERHRARGGISRERLESLVNAGHSVRSIANETGLAATTIRHWLRRYGLRTRATSRRCDGRQAKRAGIALATLYCERHGHTTFAIEGRGAYRCTKCRSERVSRWRRNAKAILVAEAGGCCRLCGYDRHPCGLTFHHLDPATKSFSVAAAGTTRSLDELRAEARKCVLLCATCHAEVEAGVATVVSSDGSL